MPASPPPRHPARSSITGPTWLPGRSGISTPNGYVSTVRFVQGACGELKPKGGPKVRFRVERLVPEREFIDVSRLLGASLTFDHQVSAAPGGGSAVSVEVTLRGPLAPVWRLLLGKGIAASVQPDLDRLARRAEGAGAVA